MPELERIAYAGMKYANEQTDKFIKGLIKEGPQTGEEKKKVAVQAMLELAAPELKLTEAKAEILVEAAVQQERASIRPPASTSVRPNTKAAEQAASSAQPASLPPFGGSNLPAGIGGSSPPHASLKAPPLPREVKKGST